MLLYLHTTAQTCMAGLAARMVQHEDYVIIPTSHWGLKTRSHNLGLSLDFNGLQWESWRGIGEDSANKLALSHQHKLVYT